MKSSKSAASNWLVLNGKEERNLRKCSLSVIERERESGSAEMLDATNAKD
jgi:hypothetical protein